MQSTREEVAINAYLSLLKTKGVDETVLMIRTTILKELSVLLAGKTLDGAGYRSVIEQYIEKIPPEDWPMHLATAREYYHFWVEDIKAITQLNRTEAFALREDGWKPEPTTLKSLTDRLKTEKFETVETWPLKAYQLALKNAGAEQALVNTRVNLAKISLMRLRQAPEKNHQSYRIVVDSTMPLFRIKNSRRLFLEVVREFYHFWSGNPEAANLVLHAA
jgi:hypothetical protein